MTDNDLKMAEVGDKLEKTSELALSIPDEQEYIAGAKIFSRFVKRPERFKNTEVVLRVRMDGQYGGWRLRDAIFTGFGFMPGDALYLNDIYVLGDDNIDVEMDSWLVDCLASNITADWLEDNAVTTGSVFEGRFKLAYETVEKGAGSRGVLEAVDAKIAKLILLEGIRVITHDTTSKKKMVGAGMNEMLSSLQKALMSTGIDSDE